MPFGSMEGTETEGAPCQEMRACCCRVAGVVRGNALQQKQPHIPACRKTLAAYACIGGASGKTSTRSWSNSYCKVSDVWRHNMEKKVHKCQLHMIAYKHDVEILQQHHCKTEKVGSTRKYAAGAHVASSG